MNKDFLQGICIRIWVLEFYRLHAGYFMVAGFLVLGMFSAESMKMLADLAVHNPHILFTGCFLPFFLYGCNTLVWGFRVMKSPENQFFKNFIFLPAGTRFTLLCRIQAGLLAPLLPFLILLLERAIRHHLLLSAASVLCFGLLLHIIPAVFWMQRLKLPFENSRQQTFSGFVSIRNTGIAGWLGRDILQREPMLLIWTKILSISVILGSVLIFYSDDYDQRLLSLALLIAAFLHLGILEAQHQLEDRLYCFRNLPFNLFARIRFWFLILLPIIGPELLVFLRNCPPETGFLYEVSAPFFWIFLLLFISQIRYLPRQNRSLKEKILPVLFFACSFAIMAHVPVWLLGIFFALAALGIQRVCYRKSEPIYG